MTIGIAGPERKVPGRSAVVGCIVAAIVVAISLILLGLVGDFLVDWIWFSSIGYPQVFWTTIGTKAGVFFVVFLATAGALWVNACLALSLARRRQRLPAGFGSTLSTVAMPSDPFEFMRDRLPWPGIIAASAGLVALLAAWGEASNWITFLQFLYQVPYGTNDPLYEKDIGFYLFSLPAWTHRDDGEPLSH